jgi:hypothetical protein
MVFRHHYTPHQEISVDESLLGIKNKTSLMQYLPNKHHHRWESNFGCSATLCPTAAWGFHIQRGQISGRQVKHPKKWPVAHRHKKLLKIGGYLNKGYHVFIGNYFMSVTLIRHLRQLSTCITGSVRRNRKLWSGSSRTNMQLDKKCIADLVPFLPEFSMRRNHKKTLSFSPSMP